MFEELKRRNVIRVAAAYAVVAWLIIQVAETIFPLFGFDEAPARFVVIVLAIGFFPALVIAWVYELTPDGLARDAEIDRSRSIAGNSGKKLDRAIMVVLALGLVYFAFDKFVLSPSRDAATVEQAHEQGSADAREQPEVDRSLAVMAFTDMSPDRDQEYLGDGIAEELLNLLAEVPELRVISRSTAFSYKGRDINLAEVARELNVAYILQGSVRKFGNRVRISAQLIEAGSDSNLWSHRYEENLGDVFDIQDEIAAAVVEKLKLTLLGRVPQVRKTDPNAYALYLQARHLDQQMTPESLMRANALYKEVTAIDPGFAPAWDGLARNYSNQRGRTPISFEEADALAREAIDTALAADPDYADAHARLGLFAARSSDFTSAVTHMERALELAPTKPSVLGNTAILLRYLGRSEQALALHETAFPLDPLNPIAVLNMAALYYVTGRWEDAINFYETALRLSPDLVSVRVDLALAHVLAGNPETALEIIGQESDDSDRLIVQAIANFAADRTVAANEALEILVSEHDEDAAYDISVIYAFRGEPDRAFQWLEKAHAKNDVAGSDILVEPLFEKLHDDPRWLLFLEKIGQSPAELDAIPFTVVLP